MAAFTKGAKYNGKTFEWIYNRYGRNWEDLLMTFLVSGLDLKSIQCNVNNLQWIVVRRHPI